MKIIKLLIILAFIAVGIQPIQYAIAKAQNSLVVLRCDSSNVGDERYHCDYNNNVTYDIICYYENGRMSFCESN